MSTTTTTRAIDLTALREEGEGRLQALRERRQALALDSLTDESARIEVDRVETEIAEVEARLRRISMAHSEQAQRALKVEQEAAQRAREHARLEGVKWQDKKRKAAQKFDRDAKVLAETMTAYAAAELELDRCLEKMGERRLYTPKDAPTGALMCAMQNAGTPRGMIGFEGNRHTLVPLASVIPTQPGIDES